MSTPTPTPAAGAGAGAATSAAAAAAPLSNQATLAAPTVVASPTLLVRIESLIATVEGKIKADASKLGSLASDVPKVEAAATKYWMLIAGLVGGLIIEHLLRFVL